MPTTRRDVLVFFASIPAASLVGCSSNSSGGGSTTSTTPIDGGNTPPVSEMENPFEVIDTPTVESPAAEGPEGNTPTVDTPEVDVPAVDKPVSTDLPLIEPNSAQALALEWELRSPRSDQNCTGCRLYSGASGSTTGPCVLFPGRVTSAGGWCNAYIPRG